MVDNQTCILIDLVLRMEAVDQNKHSIEANGDV